MKVADVMALVRRPRSGGVDAKSQRGIRLSGTRLDTQRDVAANNTSLDGPAIGREGNDWPTPDYPRDAWELNHDPGKRLQDMANSHLSEGRNPGRIPWNWNNRSLGKLGRELTGNPSGSTGLTLDITGSSAGGIGDGMFVPHTPIPRGSVIARAYARTVDDAANIPGVYVADPTRH